MKQSWDVISNLLGNDSKAQMPDSFCIDGAIIIDDPVVIANAFNNYFSNIGNNLCDRFEQNEEYRQYLNLNIVTEFNFSPVTREDIIRIAMSFKDSSPGIDDIPMRIIKENIATLSDVICFISNLSLRMVNFSKPLMIAVVTCLFKSGNPQLIENYRAISILVAFSKILEKIVVTQLMDYFVGNAYFTPSRYGFLRGLSTADAIIGIVDYMYDSFDNGECRVAVFFRLCQSI